MTDNHIIAAPKIAIQQEKMHPFVTAAIQGGQIDTQTLRELMELQRDWERGEAKKAFTESMVAMKKELPSIIDRDGKTDYTSRKGGQVNYTFTTMAHAMEIIQPHLVDFGFSLNWIPQTKDGMVSVSCKLTHVAGHSEETTMSAPPDNSGSKNPVQAIGSTQSYLERYTALAILGIVTRDMRCTDELQSDSNTIDVDKNLKAASYLNQNGIDPKEAEKYLQKDFKDWSLEDLTNLKEWIKERKSIQNG